MPAAIFPSRSPPSWRRVAGHHARQAVGQLAVAPGHADVLQRTVVGGAQVVDLVAGLGEDLGAHQPRLVAVGVEFHLPQQVAADRVAGVHQPGEQLAARPHRASRQADGERDAPPGVGAGGLVELLVPAVAAVDHAGEPVVDRPHQVGEPPAGALGEMAEFVGQHPGQLVERQPVDQWQADGEHQVLLAEEAAEPAPQAGRSVHLAVDVDPARHRRAHRSAQLAHEIVQQRLLLAAQGAFSAPCRGAPATA